MASVSAVHSLVVPGIYVAQAAGPTEQLKCIETRTPPPRSAQVETELGLVYQTKGSNLPVAEQRLNSALAIDPKNVDALLYLVTLYMKQNKIARAVSLLHKILAIDASHGEAHSLLATCYSSYRKLDYLPAIVLHLKAALVAGIDPKALKSDINNITPALTKKYNAAMLPTASVDEKLKVAQMYVDIYPITQDGETSKRISALVTPMPSDNFDARYLQGKSLRIEEKTQEAYDAFTDLMKNNYPNPDGYDSMGEILLITPGQTQLAGNIWFETIKRAQSPNPTLYREVIFYYSDVEKIDANVTASLNAAARTIVQSSAARAHIGLAIIDSQTQNFTTATSHIEAALYLDHNHPKVVEQSIRYYQNRCKQSSDSNERAKAAERIGDLNSERKRAKDAAASFKLAIELTTDPAKLAGLYLKLCNAHIEVGDSQSARAALTSARDQAKMLRSIPSDLTQKLTQTEQYLSYLEAFKACTAAAAK